MLSLSLLTPFRRPSHIQSLIDQVAADAVEGVCRRVEHRIGSLTPAEARGYVRAHALAVVEQRVDSVLAHQGGKLPLSRNDLVQRSREALIPLVLDRLRGGRRQAVTMRRAA